LAGNWLFIVCLTVWENAGMPENYRLTPDYEYQGKKEEIHKLKYNYLFDLIKYFLSVNTNSAVVDWP
jgi:hypothetical protein